MIAVVRKNISCLFFSPNSFLCNSNAQFIPSIHFFSTSRNKILKIHSSEIYDLLVSKHQFTPELASVAASRLSKFRSPSPKRANSVLSFLKENSFTTTQLQKVVIYNPRFLGFTIENLKSRLNVFQDLGLSSDEIAKILSSHQSILKSSMANVIIPSVSKLKGLLGTEHDVAKLLRSCSWFVTCNLEKTLLPNVEILKSCSIPMERILHFLYSQPRCFLAKPEIMRKSVDKAMEFGFSKTSIPFINAVMFFNHTSEGMWEVKMETLRDLGFSDNDIFTIFRKAPSAFRLSPKKLKGIIELVFATGKYNISSFANGAVALGCSIEKRIEPRIQILRLLESRDLIEKWPSLGVVATLTDDRFIDRFIRPHYHEIGEEGITKIYVEGRKR